MLVLGLLAAAVLALVVLVARWRRVSRRRLEAQGCVSEEEARRNAAPLTTAILSQSLDRERGGSSIAEGEER